MNTQQKQQEKEPKLFSLEDSIGKTLSSVKPRFYDTDSLHELLCHRYQLSRYTPKEKLIELVKEELSL